MVFLLGVMTAMPLLLYSSSTPVDKKNGNEAGKYIDAGCNDYIAKPIDKEKSRGKIYF